MSFVAAARSGDFAVVREFVESGFNIPDMAAVWAYTNGHTDIMVYLIENGADRSVLYKHHPLAYRYFEKGPFFKENHGPRSN